MECFILCQRLSFVYTCLHLILIGKVVVEVQDVTRHSHDEVWSFI